PLAPSAADREEDSYLDVTDVRSADLSHCGLVVLSSCGSGANYVTGRVATPSLAEAFVEAGAEAVIGTSWSLKDEDAARVMHAFTSVYVPSENNAVIALNKARRQLLEDGGTPNVWASYSIMLGSF